jgi:hypothetical protein
VLLVFGAHCLLVAVAAFAARAETVPRLEDYLAEDNPAVATATA